jgi:hypothetical protein
MIHADLTDRSALHRCPSCAREALVQSSPGIYACLCCRFKRDLAHHHNGGGFFFFFVLLGLLIFLLL